jgi:homoaconitase/3-isopropylmalate dehydratase large subunit
MHPDPVPKMGAGISEFEDDIAINQSVVGSCANAQIEDLGVAAEIVRERKVASGMQWRVRSKTSNFSLRTSCNDVQHYPL